MRETAVAACWCLLAGARETAVAAPLLAEQARAAVLRRSQEQRAAHNQYSRSREGIC